MKIQNTLFVSAMALSLAACGQGVKNSSPAGVGIVNGDPVSLQNDAPAQHVVGLVFLMKPQPGDQPGQQREAICTGTLISDDIVLTAAHCADTDYQKAVVVFSTDFKNISRDNLRLIVGKSVNPKWQPTNLNSNDIGDTAIVKFAGGVPEGYSPAQILTDSSVLTAGTNVLEMGFGMAFPTAEDKGVGTLRQATVAILDSTTAKTEILTDESHGQGVCEGDSGGPAFVNVNGKFYLWGVASRVFGNPPDPANPNAEPVVLCNRASLETNIVPYMDWLQTAMATLDGPRQDQFNTKAQLASFASPSLHL